MGTSADFNREGIEGRRGWARKPQNDERRLSWPLLLLSARAASLSSQTPTTHPLPIIAEEAPFTDGMITHRIEVLCM